MSKGIRMLTRKEVVAIHAASLERFGGLPGVRDEGLLESAIAQPSQSFGGVELYPTLEEKAARLAFGLAKNHAFLDGNKRVGTACMAAVLRLNGRAFRPDAGELLSTMLGVADGSVSYEELVEWVRSQGQRRHTELNEAEGQMILGATAGDVIGSVYEFDNVKRVDFPLFAERSTYTDDTANTLAVADALMEAADARQPISHALVPGMRTLVWAHMSADYGSAMRVSAAGQACETLEATELLAAETAKVTHNHPEGIRAAQATAA